MGFGLRPQSEWLMEVAMGGTANWVRLALAELGADAPDQAIKDYIRSRDPAVPDGHVAVALRRIRGPVLRGGGRAAPTSPDAPRE